jgi:hypothetical protein
MSNISHMFFFRYGTLSAKSTGGFCEVRRHRQALSYTLPISTPTLHGERRRKQTVL